MLLATSNDDYNSKYVMLLESVKNISKTGCKFNKIIYSTPTICMNGLFVKYEIKNVVIHYVKDHYHYIEVDWKNNLEVMESIVCLENDVLKNISNNLKMVTTIQDELTNPRGLRACGAAQRDGYQKNITVILRIIGLWSSSRCCGLTYQLLSKHV